MTKSKSLYQRLLDEKPWSSSSEYYIPLHMTIWALFLICIILLGTQNDSKDRLYFDPIDTTITDNIAGRPSHIDSKVGIS